MLTNLPSTNLRKARCQTFKSHGEHASLWYFTNVTGGRVRVLWNAICIYSARIAPTFGMKYILYRAVGAKIDRYAAIGLGVTLDIFFPQDITVEADATVGYNTTILAHEFMRDEWRRGPVIISKDVTIGANCTILPGVIVGSGATISAMSLVNRDVPPGAFVGGVPIRFLSHNQVHSDLSFTEE